jgi:Tol biopolymer transport system component
MRPCAGSCRFVLLGLITLAACGDQTGPESSEGTLVIAVTTTGSDRDPDGYSLALDGGAGRPVGASGRALLGGVTPGRHTITVSGLAANCAVEGDNPREVTVAPGDTTEVALGVACTAVTGALRITTITEGFAPDPDGYRVAVDQGVPQAIAAAGMVLVTGLAPGPHAVRLSDIAPECTLQGDNPAAVTLTAGQTAELTFRLDCGEMPGGELLFNGSVGDATHVFHRRPDGSIVDLTPDARGEGGRWSPDGTQIAFSGTGGIYLMDADGGHVTQLTHDGEVYPDWSPDGTRILFWPDATRGFGSVVVMNADGSDVHALSQGSLGVWSPDGSRIAFERQNGICIYDLCGIDIFTMAADGTDVRRLTSTTSAIEYAAVPAWSPDGTLIAYISGDYSGAQAPEARIITAEGIPVGSLGRVGSRIVWSPDGRAIAATTAAPGPNAPILVIPLSGGRPVELVNRPGISVPTDWR